MNSRVIERIDLVASASDSTPDCMRDTAPAAADTAYASEVAAAERSMAAVDKMKVHTPADCTEPALPGNSQYAVHRSEDRTTAAGSSNFEQYTLGDGGNPGRSLRMMMMVAVSGIDDEQHLDDRRWTRRPHCSCLCGLRAHGP